jgi:diguanylate cyclase (GGDEF)-like protein
VSDHDHADLLRRLHALERDRGFGVRGQGSEAWALVRAATAAGCEVLRARATLVQADVLQATGRTGEALDLVTAAEETARRHDDAELRARVHFLKFTLHVVAGNLTEAWRHGLLSVETLPDAAPGWLRAEHLLALTVVLDDVEHSRSEVFAELTRLARAESDRRWELFTLNNRAWWALQDGDLAAALTLVAQLRSLSERHGIALRHADLDTIACVELADGRPADALRTVRAALARGDGNTSQADHVVLVQLTLCAVLRALGRPAEAEEELARARDLATDRDLPGMLADVEAFQARLFADRGQWEDAYRARLRHDEARQALHAVQESTKVLLAQAEYDARSARRDRDHYKLLAHTDALTGLPNRRAAQDHVEGLLGGAASGDVCLFLLDVDHFKHVNDTFSHEVGDAVLVGFADVLRRHVSDRPGSFAARLGGEEFVVVLVGAAPEADRVAESLRVAVADRDWSGLCPGAPVTVSIGTAAVREGHATFSALLSAADRRLYVAKRAGRNRVATGTAGVPTGS